MNVSPIAGSRNNHLHLGLWGSLRAGPGLNRPRSYASARNPWNQDRDAWFLHGRHHASNDATVPRGEAGLLRMPAYLAISLWAKAASDTWLTSLAAILTSAFRHKTVINDGCGVYCCSRGRSRWAGHALQRASHAIATDLVESKDACLQHTYFKQHQ